MAKADERLAGIEKTLGIMAEQIKNLGEDVREVKDVVKAINGGFRQHDVRLVTIETNCRETIKGDAGRFKVLFNFRDKLWIYLGIVAAVSGGISGTFGFLAGRFIK